MGADLAIVVGVTLVLLIASGAWAEFRFADFDKLPMHYGVTGKPTRYGSRRLAIWLPTGMLIFVVALNYVLMSTLSPEQINGDPHFGIMLTCGIIVVAQIFILWLHHRWARAQG